MAYFSEFSLPDFARCAEIPCARVLYREGILRKGMAILLTGRSCGSLNVSGGPITNMGDSLSALN